MLRSFYPSIVRSGRRRLLSYCVLPLVGLSGLPGVLADELLTINLRLENHLFEPDVLRIPANTRVRLIVENLDPTAEEFDSEAMRREKIIMGHSQTTLYIGPLPSGRYAFYGDYHPRTAQGAVEVE